MSSSHGRSRSDVEPDATIDDRASPGHRQRGAEQHRAALGRLARGGLRSTRRSDGGLRLRIEDNGRGFDPTDASASSGHQGLVNMRSRAATVGATMDIDSDATGTTDRDPPTGRMDPTTDEEIATS